ncbi:Muskelin N-terminus-domain-containing protein [Blakeslea trispora]|nr:Muskelin N-terminus-domain-containing protein [Blakeslea trispora]
MIAKSKQVKLPYTIHDYSSYSGSYHPMNITINQPTQQASRWSSGLNNHEQFVTIKFDKPVVARNIIFGKFHKGHVCNLKEFKIYGGMDPNEQMLELLHNGLRNDTEPESFPLKHQSKDLIFPIKYLRIVPLSAFGANFNYSIWYLEVRGINEDTIIQRVCSEFEAFKETETVRLCLKYFRQRNMMDAFSLLKHKTGIELEHPLLSQLHQYIVMDANFEAAEQVLQRAHYELNMYNAYSENATYQPVWRQILPHQGHTATPSPRGGHQMCMDAQSQIVYVLGGWDGKQDLSDFWSFDIKRNEWTLLSEDTQTQGGPSARSCHKICFDPTSHSIFVLGRYVEPLQATGSNQSFESDFYRYYTKLNQWTKISDHTAYEGGPELIFDHQMCVDSNGKTLYVFGGRTVNGDPTLQNYSGLYAYNIKSNQWKLIRSVLHMNHRNNTSLKSRVGHSMLFDPMSRSLYVFAGQRGKDYLSDLYRYDVDHDIATEIVQDYTRDSGPDTGFNQRATFDERLQELYVLSGYKRNTSSEEVKNALWVYSIKKNTWQKVYQNENLHKQEMASLGPCPRYAHQMVYDPLHQTQYIFGGNPGDNSNPSKRLDDFWELRLLKPKPLSILRRNFYMIRMQKLKELCMKASRSENMDQDQVSNETLAALDYLRNQVTPVVDHENQSESKEFHQMCANLCLLDTMLDESDDGSKRDILDSNHYSSEDRTRLFEKILEFIPQEMKEPLGKLTNAIKLV